MSPTWPQRHAQLLKITVAESQVIHAELINHDYDTATISFVVDQLALHKRVTGDPLCLFCQSSACCIHRLTRSDPGPGRSSTIAKRRCSTRLDGCVDPFNTEAHRWALGLSIYSLLCTEAK